ncbi:MAG: sigma-70 family RNA polymerase sigma factor [Polyangiaceae bacterium]
MTISFANHALGRLRALIASHRPSVEAALRRAGVPAGDTPDGAQRVFLVAARRLDDVPPEKERAFLLGVARRVALDARRAARRRPDAVGGAASLVDDLRDAAPLADERLDHARARAAVDAALAAMDEELRCVIVLARIDGRSVTEIAELLGIPRGTAASRLRRANERFDAALTRGAARERHAQSVRRAGFLALIPKWVAARFAIAVSISTTALVLEPTAQRLATGALASAPPEAAPVATHSEAHEVPAWRAAPLPSDPPRPAPPATARSRSELVRSLAPTGIPRVAAPAPSPPSPISSAPPVAPIAAPPMAPAPDRLLEELRSLEAVRAAASVGDTARARALLDAHRAAFPSGDLGPEAALLGADVAGARAGGRPAHAR